MFEGTEKKFELWTTDSCRSFRTFDECFWKEIVELSKANIISKISNTHCDAYLLSESSLIVFDHKVIMITCGQTTLIRAAEKLFQSISKEDISYFVYERKNENFPQLQPSDFSKDCKILDKYIEGEPTIIGSGDKNFVALYQTTKKLPQISSDRTIEIFMHEISNGSIETFSNTKPEDHENIRKSSALRQLIPGYITEDHFFEPAGYSLNAVKGEFYFTVHVTPQAEGSFVSFESNDRFEEVTLSETINHLLSVFEPKSTELQVFNHRLEMNFNSDYKLLSSKECNFESGYIALYYHFERNIK